MLLLLLLVVVVVVVLGGGGEGGGRWWCEDGEMGVGGGAEGREGFSSVRCEDGSGVDEEELEEEEME